MSRVFSRVLALCLGLVTVPISLPVSAAPAPLATFATCAGRLTAMTEMADDPEPYVQQSAGFNDLVSAVMSTDEDARRVDILRREARTTVMSLVLQHRYAFDTVEAESAQRALSRLLSECEGLIL